MLRDLRACLQTGTPLGNERFRAKIEQALSFKFGYSSCGSLSSRKNLNRW